MHEGTSPAHLASALQRRLKLPCSWKPGTQWYSATEPKIVVSFTKKIRALATSSGEPHSTPVSDIDRNYYITNLIIHGSYQAVEDLQGKHLPRDGSAGDAPILNVDLR